MSHPRPPRRRRAAWLAASLTAAALLATPLSATAEPDAPSADDVTVDSALTSAVKGGKDATFFVVLKDQPTLSVAKGKKSHAARAAATYDELRDHAEASQRSLTAFLDEEKVGHQDYWIANTVQVTGDADLVAELAKRSDVASIVKEQTYHLDDTESRSQAAPTATTTADDAAPGWGVTDINADDVWNEYDDRGEGIVIANIDSGVQFDHPDLVENYRGNDGDGTFTHEYNFYDATGECGASGVPCDNNGHGTHTMGTMVGKNGIGVAPNATWIAAKGCETSSCSDESLLKAGQWILAPTDANGQNPRPDLAPNIVNNSWGGGQSTFYQEIIEAWNSAGIFEAFAAGNSGDGRTCSTTEAPGAGAPAYGVGAYGENGAIASFSGFGPSLVDGSAKPNIAAPGVNIVSTWPGSAYQSSNGTSMATPHVAGAVALLWSESPALIGDIDGTRRLLNDGARDVDDTHCGGTADANNVWGEGKLDILGSVDLAPHTAGTLTGTVTDKSTGAGIGGITVTTTSATGTRTTVTGPTGAYRLSLVPGTYDLTFSGYGHVAKTVSGLAVADGAQLKKNVKLAVAPTHAVSGTVLDVAGAPLPGATVTAKGTPLDAVTTGPDGSFTLPVVAAGTYTLAVEPAAPTLCNGISRTELVVDRDLTRTVRLPALSDNAGTTCTPADYAWVKGTDTVALSGDEDAATIPLPFWVSLYGVDYSSASVTTNGLINFLEPRLGDYANTALPEEGAPNGIAAPFWDDLTLDKKSSVQTVTKGKVGNRTFAVVWNKAKLVSDGSRVTFEAVFEEATGDVVFQYKSVPDAGAGATVGIENQTGTDALQYSYDEAVLTDGSAIRFSQGA
ncbi:S8 family serine peptidase [Cellulosimicrobium terreum]|nr:S8 family serine peptidase [Cellulosimicrobium terreum]